MNVKSAHIEFEPTLQFFLSGPGPRNRVGVRFRGQQSVKHLVESMGVPHTEIGEVQINATTADLGRIAQDGDEVVVRAARAQPPHPVRFLLDAHLGRLAASLRMLGFDTAYRNDYDDLDLVDLAHREQRVLLTRDRRLLMRKAILLGYCVRSLAPRLQLMEVVRRYSLAAKIVPFHRCMRCNGVLESIAKAAVLPRLEPLTAEYYDAFRICPACQQVYWQGSHYDHMLGAIARLENDLAATVIEGSN